MQQALERLFRRGIGKYALAHALPVHFPAANVVLAEDSLDLRQRRAAGRGQLVGDGVGIDHRGAEPGKLVSRGAFSAADAAGEPDHEAHSSCRVYQRRIGSPQYRATIPAIAR